LPVPVESLRLAYVYVYVYVKTRSMVIHRLFNTNFSYSIASFTHLSYKLLRISET